MLRLSESFGSVRALKDSVCSFCRIFDLFVLCMFFKILVLLSMGYQSSVQGLSNFVLSIHGESESFSSTCVVRVCSFSPGVVGPAQFVLDWSKFSP